MLYNAVLVLKDWNWRKPISSKILGRVFIRDLKKVPSEWVVEYREEYISKETDIGSLMCSRDEPIHLISFEENDPWPWSTTSSGKLSSEVEPPSSKMEKNQKAPLIDLTTDDTGEEVKRGDEEEPEVPPFKMSLRSSGPASEVDENVLKPKPKLKKPDWVAIAKEKAWKRLAEIQNEGRIVQIIQKDGRVKRCNKELGCGYGAGGGPGPFLLRTQNLEIRQVTREGVPKTNSWEIYGIGMNLYGTCTNDSCISKLTKSKEVVLQMNYGRIAMTKTANKFECPACKIGGEEREKFYKRRRMDQQPANEGMGEVGTFTPKSFLLTFGRTLFRFKKIGVNEPIKTVLMESMELQEEYKTFDGTARDSEAEYDFIEITTVGKNTSPFVCAHCNRRILEKEVNLVCGHSLHPTCQGKKRSPGVEECAVCTSKLYKNLRDVPGTSRSASDAVAELERFGTRNLKLPSDWYVEGDRENPEEGFVAKWDFEMEDSERLLVEERLELTMDLELPPIGGRRRMAARPWI